MGCHHFTELVPRSTQHQYQQVHSINTDRELLQNHGPRPLHSMSTNEYTASMPLSKQHSKPTEDIFKHHALAPLNSISANEYTASIPTSTQRQYQQKIFKQVMGCHHFTASVPTSTRHQYQQVHSIHTSRGCFRENMGCHHFTASIPTSPQHQYQQVLDINTNRGCV